MLFLRRHLLSRGARTRAGGTAVGPFLLASAPGGRANVARPLSTVLACSPKAPPAAYGFANLPVSTPILIPPYVYLDSPAWDLETDEILSWSDVMPDQKATPLGGSHLTGIPLREHTAHVN